MGDVADALADRVAELALKASDWDPRGFLYGGEGSFRKTYKDWLGPEAVPSRLAACMKEKGLTLSMKGVVTAKDGSSWPVRTGAGWQQSRFGMALDL